MRGVWRVNGMAQTVIHRSLDYYVRKMTSGERKCRRTGRHVWPTDYLDGKSTLPPGVRVTGQLWEGGHRLRIVEYCDSCGSEGISFRSGNGHYDPMGPRRRVVYGPDHVQIPLEVEAWPKLIRQAEDTETVAKLFVRAARTTA